MTKKQRVYIVYRYQYHDMKHSKVNAILRSSGDVHRDLDLLPPTVLIFIYVAAANKRSALKVAKGVI